MHILHLMDTASSIPILILLNTGSLLPSGSIIIVDNAYAILIMHFRPLGVSVEHPLFTRKMLGLGYIYKPSCHIGHESERWRWRNASKRRNLGNTTWPSANLAVLWFNGNGNRRQPGNLPARFCFRGSLWLWRRSAKYFNPIPCVRSNSDSHRGTYKSIATFLAEFLH